MVRLLAACNLNARADRLALSQAASVLAAQASRRHMLLANELGLSPPSLGRATASSVFQPL